MRFIRTAAIGQKIVFLPDLQKEKAAPRQRELTMVSPDNVFASNFGNNSGADPLRSRLMYR
jgi:hypothetical protein